MKFLHSRRLGLILFEPHHDHRTMAEALGLAAADIKSAGFVGVKDVLDAYCCGESKSLATAATRADTYRLQSWLKVGKMQREDGGQ